jgi:stearoyl-CoA desaturase (delta-9 desaturase)
LAPKNLQKLAALHGSRPLRAGISRFRLSTISWPHFVGIALLHGFCLFAPSTFSWSALAVAFVLWTACGLGLSMGYHRLLTHRGFETSNAFRYLLATLGTLNFQGGPVSWVGTHRIHHRDSDTENDPHSPKHGFVWAHLLWCVTHDPLGRDRSLAAGDLKKEAGLRWLDKWWWVPQAGLAAVLFVIGGWSWVVWGVAVRTVFSYHATWLVNSASHSWGYRNFNTKDDSRNNWWVALLTWGEGWHNNHHAFQRSARHGMRWFEVDATYLSLRVLEWMRVVRNLYVPEPERLR